MFSRADFTHDVPSWNRHCRSIQQTWVPGKGQSFQTLSLQNRACAGTAPTSPFTSTPVCTAANLGSLLPWHLGGFRSGRDDLDLPYETEPMDSSVVLAQDQHQQGQGRGGPSKAPLTRAQLLSQSAGLKCGTSSSVQ